MRIGWTRYDFVLSGQEVQFWKCRALCPKNYGK